jgi:hypothetical protein
MAHNYARFRSATALIKAFVLIGLSARAAHCPPAADVPLNSQVGIYVWGQLPSAPYPLIRAADDVRSLGADKAIRLAITPYWDSLPNSNPLEPLYIKMYRHDYWTVLNEFPVVMITAYDAASYYTRYRNCQSEGACDALFRAVRLEFFQFALELAKIDGTFVIANWEPENDDLDPAHWDVYRAYLQARLDGINAAADLAQSLRFPGTVYTAFEFLVMNGFKGKLSGLELIGTRLQGVDFLSYSAWHSIGWDYGPQEMEDSFFYGIRDIRQFARDNNLTDRIIVGEFGDLWDLHSDFGRTEAMVNGSLRAGAELVFNWVAHEQPGQMDERGRDVSHFGKFFLDGKLTPQGLHFARMMVSSDGDHVASVHNLPVRK